MKSVVEFVICRKENGELTLPYDNPDYKGLHMNILSESASEAILQHTGFCVNCQSSLYASQDDYCEGVGKVITLFFACDVTKGNCLGLHLDDTLESRIEGETTQWIDLTLGFYNIFPGNVFSAQKTIKHLTHYGSKWSNEYIEKALRLDCKESSASSLYKPYRR